MSIQNEIIFHQWDHWHQYDQGQKQVNNSCISIVILIYNCFSKMCYLFTHLLRMERCIYYLWSFVNVFAFVVKHNEIVLGSNPNAISIAYAIVKTSYNESYAIKLLYNANKERACVFLLKGFTIQWLHVFLLFTYIWCSYHNVCKFSKYNIYIVVLDVGCK